jgi:hypothetical protein
VGRRLGDRRSRHRLRAAEGSSIMSDRDEPVVVSIDLSEVDFS